MVDQIGKAVKHSVCYEQPDGQKRDELNDGLSGNGENETVLMLCRIDFSGAKSNRKYCQHDRRAERQVRDVGLLDLVERADDSQQRGGNRFELQRHIGNNADERDNRHHRSYHLGFAIAGGDKIGC